MILQMAGSMGVFVPLSAHFGIRSQLAWARAYMDRFSQRLVGRLNQKILGIQMIPRRIRHLDCLDQEIVP